MVMSDDCHLIEQQLALELKRAKETWDQACSMLDQVSVGPSIGPSDAVTNARAACQRERSAAAEYAVALERFSGFIMDGEVR